MVKKMVRFALACEYARQPIRRADISAKGGLSSAEIHEEGMADGCGSAGHARATVQGGFPGSPVAVKSNVRDGDDGAAAEGEGHASTAKRYRLLNT